MIRSAGEILREFISEFKTSKVEAKTGALRWPWAPPASRAREWEGVGERARKGVSLDRGANYGKCNAESESRSGDV